MSEYIYNARNRRVTILAQNAKMTWVKLGKQRFDLNEILYTIGKNTTGRFYLTGSHVAFDKGEDATMFQLTY